jgi:signal transduction histidine kinase/HAMP domain-containing protein
VSAATVGIASARMSGRVSLLRQGWQRLNLWPRLVITLAVGFLLLFGVFSLLALRAVNDSTGHVLRERLVIAQMAAAEENRVLQRGFNELQKATEFATFDPRDRDQSAEFHMLAHAYGRLGAFSLGVYYLDPHGRVVLSWPVTQLPLRGSLADRPYVTTVINTKHRDVSSPFRDRSGRPAVALTLPIRNTDGTLRSMLVGVLDVSSPDVVQPLEYATKLGSTGHAELVDEKGVVIASTMPGEFMQQGEHLPFYLQMLKAGTSGVENVAYDPGAPISNAPHHVMAFAPLSAAPWGVAVGGSAQETFAPVVHLRNTLLLAGALSLVVIGGLALLGAHLHVRPVQQLTEAAVRMAAGDLTQPVRAGGGGEIGVLRRSLEAMRVQLKESLETVQRWGEELESKVAARTSALTARNRQLAAVTAVATAANQARDVDDVVGRCLEVVLVQTGMTAGAIRLLDPESGELGIPTFRGGYDRFDCRHRSMAVGECPCSLVAAGGTPLRLDPRARKQFELPCTAPESQALTILPLKGPGGSLGTLSLATGDAQALRPVDLRTLEAICNQLAIAIENARLLGELRELEAKAEVQRVKAELISAVSHELRTPLGFIKGYATTLLREDGDRIDPATRREFVEIIDEETDRLEKMIDDLLDASRLQAGRLHVERRPTAIAGLLTSAVNKIRPALLEAGHEIAVQLPDGDVHVLADPMRVEQVLDNLLDNAARYSEPGTPLEVAMRPEDGHVVVSVTDHGDGIPDEEADRVFEPFHRGDNSRRRGVRGTGLGLAISRGIVEALSGRLWVVSKPGRGSTFHFSLPTIEAAAGSVDVG